MSIVLIHPVCPEGKVPSTDWAYPDAVDFADWDDWSLADIVDAQHIVYNWLILASHVNGGLNGSDIATTATPLAEDDYVLNEEESDESWPTTHQRHSHDGYDSALLASGVVTEDILGETAFGMLRIPILSVLNGGMKPLLMHGRCPVSSEDLNAGTASLDIPFPYDWYFWDSGGDGRLYAAVTRVVASPVIPDFLSWTAEQRSALFANGFNRVTDGDALDAARLKVSTLDDATATVFPGGWYYTWASLALV